MDPNSLVTIGVSFLLRTIATALLLNTCLTGTSRSWGNAGHSIVAEIAQRRLEPKVARRVAELLGNSGSLASVAGWADFVQPLRPETRNWHFVNIPIGASGYDPARDCRPSPAGDCIVEAVRRFRTRLADNSAALQSRREALIFLVHLVADLHQPVHCAAQDQDAGGNALPVRFVGTVMSLHRVWDVGLLEQRSFDWGEIVLEIEAGDLPNEPPSDDDAPVRWAWQCHLVARAVAYAIPRDRILDSNYVAVAYSAARRQLALAGVRLAIELNAALRQP